MISRRWGIVVGVLLAACGGGETQKPALTPDPEPEPTDEQIAALQNAQTTVADNGDAGNSATVATEDAETALRSSCEASRGVRSQEARDYAQAWMATVDRIGKHGAAIQRACVIKNLSGPRLSAERDGHGRIVRLRPAANDHVVCKGALPAGITQDDARLYLYTRSSDFEERIVLAESAHLSEDQKCADLDKAAGFDSQVTYGDSAGVGALARYGAAPKR